MKLVHFTPVLRNSAIGRMAALVTRSLTRDGHDVVVVRSEDESLFAAEGHDFGVVPLNWTDPAVATHVASADACIYEVGDNYPYHKGAVLWLRQAPGIVCLHDFFLGNLFQGWAQAHLPQAQDILERLYGAEVASGYFTHTSLHAFIESTCHTAPMTEWIASWARGVVTHSNWGVQRVLKACAGPVQVAPLAYDAAGAAASPAEAAAARSAAAEVRVLTIGLVNSNKRIPSVIRAIGGSPQLVSRVRYRVVGRIDAQAASELTRLAAEQGVHLEISGEVDHDELVRAMNEADIVTCLRLPSLEAASASAIEAMLHGKATIVTDIGFYAEIPNDCVFKVRPDHEIGDLRQALERLAAAPEDRVKLGSTAKQWASRTFTADNYARQLVAMAEATARARPALDAVDFFVATLKGWGASSPLLEHLGLHESLGVFDGRGRREKRP